MTGRLRGHSVLVAAALGAVLVLGTSVLLGLDTPVGWAIYGAAVGAAGGWIGAAWRVSGRSNAWLGVAVVIYLLGVFAMPIFGPLLELEAPLVSRLSRDHLLTNIGAMYAMTPIGLATAVAFVPACLACGLGWSVVLDELGVDGDVRPRPAASSEHDPAETRFDRRVTIAVIAITVIAIGGFLWLASSLSSVGY